MPDSENATKQLELLHLSCSSQGGFIRVSQNVQAHLKERNVPQMWRVDGHGNDFNHWKKGLQHFAPLIFKPAVKL
ncbi:MAG TPA: hypothetical protein VNO52_02400 [Methylomirabilota bacterium]|nr:hypothetical protein [Methylomirabilota bacterium]